MSQLVAKIAREKNWPFSANRKCWGFCRLYSVQYNLLFAIFRICANKRPLSVQTDIFVVLQKWLSDAANHALPPPLTTGGRQLLWIPSHSWVCKSSFCTPLHTFANLLSAYLTRHLSGYHSTLAALGCHGIVFIFKKVFLQIWRRLYFNSNCITKCT